MSVGVLIGVISVFIFFEAIPTSFILYYINRIKKSKTWDLLDAELIDKIMSTSKRGRGGSHSTSLNPVLKISLPDGTFINHKYNMTYLIDKEIGSHIKIRYKRENNKDYVYIPGSYTKTINSLVFSVMFIGFIFGLALYQNL